MGGGTIETFTRFRGASEYCLLFYPSILITQMRAEFSCSSQPTRVNPVSPGPLTYTSSSLPIKAALVWCAPGHLQACVQPSHSAKAVPVWHTLGPAIMPRWPWCIIPQGTPNLLLIQASCPSKIALVEHTQDTETHTHEQSNP